MRIPACALLAAAACTVEPLPLLHPLFSDHMVFPRDRAAPVWGWAAPDARVRVGLAGASAETVVGADGRWQVALGPVRAGGPYELIVDGPQRLVRSDVLVGDVWLFSGQSNMEMGVSGAEGGSEEIARAGEAAGLRLLHVGKRASGVVHQVPAGAPVSWQLPGPGTIGGFSAVAWFTGRALNRELQVPVGLVSCAWSGSNIRGWMSQAAIVRTGLYADELARLQPLAVVEAQGGKSVSEQEMDAIRAWWAANDPGTAAGWQDSATVIGVPPWKPVEVPMTWREDGVAWLARDVTLPPEAAGRAAWLRLGSILNEEATFVNGRQVGSTGGWTQPRSHRINPGVLHTGVNRIAIRVKSQNGQGAAAAAATDWHLDADGLAPVPLAGTWNFVLSAPAAGLQAKPEATFQGGNRSPTMMYNAGIASLAPFAFSGVVWYQGEQDAGNSDYYRLLPALIGDWRSTFADPKLPWVTVQLPGFGQPVTQAVQPRVWFGLVRDAQLQSARSQPGVGLAVTVDVGDADDVHPRRKREVGERAARAALGVAHGHPGGGGALFAGAEAAGGAMRVRFERANGALALRPGPATGFAVAGADRVWHPAAARVESDVVVVSAPDVPVPLAVRYAWADTPAVSLYDAAGVPASPFRSDDW